MQYVHDLDLDAIFVQPDDQSHRLSELETTDELINYGLAAHLKRNSL